MPPPDLADGWSAKLTITAVATLKAVTRHRRGLAASLASGLFSMAILSWTSELPRQPGRSGLAGGRAPGATGR